jgi:hypothetical protein
MSTAIMVRPLTKGELQFQEFRKSDIGKKVVSLGCPVSIMGPSDDYYVRELYIERQVSREYFGDGVYIDDYLGPSLDKNIGRTVPVVWSIDEPYNYLLRIAEECKIPVFTKSSYRLGAHPLYFERAYADAFLDAFHYADCALGEWYNNRFFLSRWLGGISPDWSSAESKAIQNEVRRILAKAKKS